MRCLTKEPISGLQLQWKKFPPCFLPEQLRGLPVNEVDPLGLEFCIDFVETEDMNAASTSNDVLQQGRQNMVTFLIASGAILMALFFLVFVAWYTRHRAQYYTHEDQLGECRQLLIDWEGFVGVELILMRFFSSFLFSLPLFPLWIQTTSPATRTM